MSYTLNNKLKDLTPYDPIEGEYEIRLDANESYYNINSDLSGKISKGITGLSLNRYPDPYAKNAVKAFADFYGIEEKYITAGNGSDELISIISSCFLEKCDKVVTLTPDFSMYAFYGSLYELEALEFSKENDLTVNVQKLITYCNDNNAGMLIFSNPCNPTSLGISKEDIHKILNGVNCLVVLDEAYMDFWGESMLDEISKYDNLIILKTCSKAIGLAGIRFGFAVAGETITTALRAAKSPYNTDLISQKIVEIAFSEKELLQSKIKEIISQTKALSSQINELNSKYNLFEKVYNSNTNFVFIKTVYSEKIYYKLLKKSIAVRKFNGYLRISTGNVYENSRLITALDEILNNLSE